MSDIQISNKQLSAFEKDFFIFIVRYVPLQLLALTLEWKVLLIMDNREEILQKALLLGQTFKTKELIHLYLTNDFSEIMEFKVILLNA